MTQDEIIEMAREAGGIDIESRGWTTWVGTQYTEFLERFANLVAAKEREACAMLCDLTMLQNQEAINELDDDEHIAKCFIQGAMTQLVKTSKAIRARGKQA